MIGGGHMDIDGALWGFGGKAEPRAAGADQLASVPGDLAALIAA